MGKVIAIPSEMPGGLDAAMGMHFGHCQVYTLAEIENGAVKNVSTLPGVPHAEGGCLSAVQYLADHGVNVLLAGGMGMRPLMGFRQIGIDVFFAGDQLTVGSAVKAWIENRLVPFSEDSTCRHHSH